jgi:hypothetical protein
MNSRVPKTRKPKCRNLEIPTLIGDNYAMGQGERGWKFREPGVGEGSECENLRGPKPRNPETSKFLKS